MKLIERGIRIVFSSPIRTIAGGALLLMASACSGASSVSGSSLPATNALAHRVHGAGSSLPETGTLFVADYNGNDVAVLSTGVAGAPADLAADVTIKSGVTEPIVVTTDSAGDLFVGNVGDSTVKEYVNGSLTPSFTIKNVYLPQGIAIDPEGNLWVSQLSSLDVPFGVVDEYAYTASKKTFASKPSQTITGSGASALLFPHGLAFDTKGDLFIADPGHHGVLFELTPGSTNPMVVQLPTTPAGVQEPFDVKIAGTASSQSVYVSDFSSSAIVGFSLGASLKETWASDPFEAASVGHATSAWLAVDGNGFLYCSQSDLGSEGRSATLYDPPGTQEVGWYGGNISNALGLAFSTTSKFSARATKQTKKELR
jgi:hypothetical protein